MRIQFCGANRTVTGSCHLIEVNGRRIFLDFGMHQGPREWARKMNEYLPDDARSADAIILSHGHFDHCGKLPVVVRAGFNGPIYCTPATAEVTRVVLEDAAEIQVEDAEYLNRRHRSADDAPVQPLFRPHDVPPVMRLMRRVNYGQKVDLGNDVSFTFFDAGHILGSAYVILNWPESGRERSLLFTADIGRSGSPIIRDPQPLAGPVDQFITESTYGNVEHAPMAEVEPQFLDAVKWCAERRSRLLIPAFAVGRTQTVLWYIEKFIHEGIVPAMPIFVDSPMAVDISRVHSTFRDNYDEQTRQLIGTKDLFNLARVTFTPKVQDSKQINSAAGLCVIIASSPTCEFGRIQHHLRQSVERENDMVIFVGWTPPQTLGRRLQDGQKRVRIHDQWYDVRCQIRTIHGLSAHADGNELLKFLQPTLKAESSGFVVHGEPDQAETLAGRMLKAGLGRATIPAIETSAVTGQGALSHL